MPASINTVTRDLIVPAYTPDVDGLNAFVPSSSVPSLVSPCVLYQDAPALSVTATAATFTGITLADNAGKMQLVSSGVHGLTIASVGAYINIATGTGWNLGLFKVLSVEDTKTLTIDTPYNALLGAPITTKVTNAFNVVSKLIPGGYLSAGASLEWHYQVSLTSSANSKGLRFFFGGGGVGGSLGTGTGMNYTTTGHTFARGVAHMYCSTDSEQKFPATGFNGVFTSGASTYTTRSGSLAADTYASFAAVVGVVDELITFDSVRLTAVPRVL